MPDELPKGWVKTTLGEVCLPVATIQPGASPDAEFTYFDIGGIDNERNRIAETKTMTGRNAPNRARQAVHKDDILFSTVRTYLRKIALVEKDYPNPIASTGFTVIRAAEGVSSQFLFFQVLSENFLQPLHALQTGSSYPAVRDRDVLTQPILLPPTHEQEQIAAKLNAALSRLERAETATHRAKERLQRYRVAVLQAAVTGELTRTWRDAQRKNKKANPESGKALLQRLLVARRERWEEGEIERLRATGKTGNDEWKTRYAEPAKPKIEHLSKLPTGWVWASLDQLLLHITDGDHQPPPQSEIGVPLLVIGNISSGKLDFANTRFVSKVYAKAVNELRKPVRGDILYSLVGSFGIAVKVDTDLEFCIQRHLAVLRPHDLSPTNYIHFALNSTSIFLQAAAVATGTAQKTVPLGGLRRIAVPLPPFDEQAEIVGEVERRLTAAAQLAISLDHQVERARATRQSLLQEAFAGRLVPQNSMDQPASVLLERIRTEKVRRDAEPKPLRRGLPPAQKKRRGDSMQEKTPSFESLSDAWERIGRKADARRLFDEAGYGADQVVQFYEALRSNPELISAFAEVAVAESRHKHKPAHHVKEMKSAGKGRFRLIELWLQDYKNLKDYTVRFDPAHGLDIVLGWNGTGKSNLFEALVIIFRDLHGWWEKNRWPVNPMKGFRLRYEIDERIVEVTWRPDQMLRPALKASQPFRSEKNDESLHAITRKQLPLPRFLFGYYSGPTNRLAELFLPMKQAHYERLRTAKTDDTATLANLLEQRRFFCAETHHAKYVLLAFCYKEDPEINRFLEDRLRIVGFESALFIIRKPRWHRNNDPKDFWGAAGIMRRVMERLREFAIAPMVVEQTVSNGYNSTREEHYYFFLPDAQSLHAFAAEYADARTFFIALESTDFSELIHDVKIQVRVKTTNSEKVPITFHQLSEGEQQLLMVLGLLRFTKSHQSLVLLDEPDTHLNPHWNVDYLKDIVRVMRESDHKSAEQQTSQILMATHDPIVIASLVKEQVHLLKRDMDSLRCYWEHPSENPRGLGFTGILTSEMFGFRSDLDSETLNLLDKQVSLAGKEKLNREEAKQLENITQQVEDLGFKSASSDPYYRAFIKAVVRRQEVHNHLLKPTLTKVDLDTLQRETDEILAEIEEEEAKTK